MTWCAFWAEIITHTQNHVERKLIEAIHMQYYYEDTQFDHQLKVVASTHHLSTILIVSIIFCLSFPLLSYCIVHVIFSSCHSNSISCLTHPCNHATSDTLIMFSCLAWRNPEEKSCKPVLLIMREGVQLCFVTMLTSWTTLSSHGLRGRYRGAIFLTGHPYGAIFESPKWHLSIQVSFVLIWCLHLVLTIQETAHVFCFLFQVCLVNSTSCVVARKSKIVECMHWLTHVTC